MYLGWESTSLIKMNRTDVAVGIIFNKAGQVLVGQRTVADRYLDKWEFPGGKLELGERVEQALFRELQEELAIEIHESSAMMVLDHNYPDRNVRLHVRIVNNYTGEPHGVEGQALLWCAVQDLYQLDFLTGNRDIIDKLNQRAVDPH